MPYIKHERRADLAADLEPKTAGELNYAFTLLALDFLDNQKDFNYQVLNDVLGAFEGAKTEFYRRVVVPYEEQRMLANGDVYGD